MRGAHAFRNRAKWGLTIHSSRPPGVHSAHPKLAGRRRLNSGVRSFVFLSACVVATRFFGNQIATCSSQLRQAGRHSCKFAAARVFGYNVATQAIRFWPLAHFRLGSRLAHSASPLQSGLRLLTYNLTTHSSRPPGLGLFDPNI